MSLLLLVAPRCPLFLLSLKLVHQTIALTTPFPFKLYSILPPFHALKIWASGSLSILSHNFNDFSIHLDGAFNIFCHQVLQSFTSNDPFSLLQPCTTPPKSHSNSHSPLPTSYLVFFKLILTNTTSSKIPQPHLNLHNPLFLNLFH